VTEQAENNKDDDRTRYNLDLFALFNIVADVYGKDFMMVKDHMLKNNEIEFELLRMRMQNRLIAIIFTHTFLDALIYDYGATHKSDSYIKKYVDKLDIKSKWVVIPKIVTGKDFPTDSKAFELLQKLTKLRNNIIHLKTSNSKEKELSTFLQSDVDVRELIGIDFCMDCMSELLTELERLDNLGWDLFEYGYIKKIISREYQGIMERAFKDLGKQMRTK
jgi:hypothetical protein